MGQLPTQSLGLSGLRRLATASGPWIAVKAASAGEYPSIEIKICARRLSKPLNKFVGALGGSVLPPDGFGVKIGFELFTHVLKQLQHELLVFWLSQLIIGGLVTLADPVILADPVTLAGPVILAGPVTLAGPVELRGPNVVCDPLPNVQLLMHTRTNLQLGVVNEETLGAVMFGKGNDPVIFGNGDNPVTFGNGDNPVTFGFIVDWPLTTKYNSYN